VFNTIYEWCCYIISESVISGNGFHFYNYYKFTCILQKDMYIFYFDYLLLLLIFISGQKQVNAFELVVIKWKMFPSNPFRYGLLTFLASVPVASVNESTYKVAALTGGIPFTPVNGMVMDVKSWNGSTSLHNSVMSSRVCCLNVKKLSSWCMWRFPQVDVFSYIILGVLYHISPP